MEASLTGRARYAVLGLSAVFLAGLFCIPAGAAKFVMVPALVGLAGLRLWQGRTGRTLGRFDLYFLLLAAGWTALTVAATHPTLATFGTLEANVLLLFLFAMAVDAIVDAGAFRAFLALLVGFATLEAVISMALQLWTKGLFSERLFSFGRAANPIPAAGGYAVAVLAALMLLRPAPERPAMARRRAAGGLAIIVLLAALVWSASRGPLVSVMASLALTSLWPARRHPLRLFTMAILVWGVIASFVLFEADIKAALCSYSIGRLCAQSLRLDIWEWVAAAVRAHPIVGLGFDFRFPGDRPHAHNGLAALALGGGVPFLIAFLTLGLLVSRRASELPDTVETRFAVQAFVFAFGYMATDLPNPIGFINTHYLFLWLPIFLIASYGQRKAATRSPTGSAALAPAG